MSWRRILRVLVAIAGLGCAASLYVFFRHPRPRPAAAPATPHDDQVTLESAHGDSLEYKGNQEEWRIEFEHMTVYANNRTRFDKPHYSMAMAHEDRQVQMWADEAESAGKAVQGSGPGTVLLTGHVRIETSDHWTILDTSATYDDASGTLVMPGLVTFTRDRFSGRGVGATYDKSHERLELQAQAHLTMTPDATGSGGLDATAGHMVVARADGQASLDDQARLVRDREILSADHQSLFFTKDEKGLTRLELRGHSSVVPKPGMANAPPDMRADDADLTMQPDGHTLQEAALRGSPSSLTLTDPAGAKVIRAPIVDVRLAPDGQTVTRLDASRHVSVVLPPTKDEPGRTITATTLTAAGTDRAGLTSAIFSDAVTFIEHVPATASQPAAERTGTSRALALTLNGDLGAIDVAEFRDDVHFVDTDEDAVAPHALYYEAKGQMALDSAGTRTQPRVVNSRVIVDANTVTVTVDTHDVEAVGAVQTKTRPAAPAPGAPPSVGLFDETKPIFGSAARLTYLDASEHATYTAAPGGFARVSQDDNEVKGDTVIVDQTTNDLHATGHVSSTFLTEDSSPTPSSSPQPQPSTPAPPQPPTRDHVTADDMTYTDASRVAHYTGGHDPARLESAQGVTTAATIDLILAKESRSVERMTADKDVHLTSPTREARGDHLTYESSTGIYVLRGSPAIAKGPDNNSSDAPTPTTPGHPPAKPPSCTLSTGSELTFTAGGSEGTGHAADGQTANWPCDKPLPPIKKLIAGHPAPESRPAASCATGVARR